MSLPPTHPRDPLPLHFLLALIFLSLCLVRLAVPSTPFFDEVHYLPAARAIIDVSHPVNIEHPPLGKQLIALGIAIAGDTPWGWRIMSALAGALAILAAMRATWFASQSSLASVLAGVFLASGFPLLVHARIAMLDIFMCAFLFLALWMCAGAVREAETGRRRLAIAGVALGCAMASKWNAVPLAMLPGLTFLAARARVAGWAVLSTRRGDPVAGVRLVEAALWLGLVPLVVYAATFWPAIFYHQGAIPISGLVELHRQMLDLQTEVLAPHPYESRWWEWIGNWRAIWYLYEVADGAQRGVLLIGNPFSALAMLPALLWCGIAWWRDGRRDCLAILILYAASLATWIVLPKAVQFYYHYLLPHCFGMVALALATDRLWQRGARVFPTLIVLTAVTLFAWFYPILTAAPLDGEMAFLDWAWLESWR